MKPSSESKNKVHYLNKTKVRKLKPVAPLEKEEVSPQTTTSENDFSRLIHEMTSRLDNIEGEFKKKLEDLERMETNKILDQQEASALMRSLEKKFQKATEELFSLKSKKHTPNPDHSRNPLSVLFEWLNPLKYESLLKSLWLGQSLIDSDVDEFGMDPQFIQKLKPYFDFLYDNYWRVSVHGIQNVPSEGRGLVVANHSGTLPYDGTMIAASIMNEHPIRRDVRFLVEDFVYHFPFLGTLMYRIGGVRACPENAERLLKKNHLVTVFPEGIKGIGKNYKNRYHLQRFGRGGFIKLALRMRAPIIPTAVIGAEEIHPLLMKSTVLARTFGIPYIPITPTFPLLGALGMIPLPTKWTIYFGEPITFDEYSPEQADDQLLVNKLSEMVREKIQEMVIEGVKNRRSVFLG